MYYRTIKIKPADINVDNYLNYHIEHNSKSSKFKFSDHKGISNTKIFLQNAIAQISLRMSL